MSIYTEMVAAGIQCRNRDGHLLVPDVPTAHEIINQYPCFAQRTVAFCGENCSRWLEVPNAYDPYWDRFGRAPIGILA